MVDLGSVGSALQHKDMKTGHRVPRLLLTTGLEGQSLKWGGAGGGPRVRPEEQLRWRGHRVVLGAGAQRPAFAPSTWEVAVGSWVFMYLIAHSRPQLHLQAGICRPL